MLEQAAVGEMEALEAFILTGAKQMQTTLTEASALIAEHEKEIARLRQEMELATQEQKQRTQAANQKKLEIQPVLEFFGEEAVAQVVRESPKLHEPPTEG